MHECSLAPCHWAYQFYVSDGKLSLQWYQRSIDSGIGLPINIISYAILTRIFAKAANLEPGEIILSGGDAHIYLNIVEQIKEQIKREPYPFPTMNIKKDIQTIEDMENLSFEDFEFHNYQHHPTIKMVMSV